MHKNFLIIGALIVSGALGLALSLYMHPNSDTSLPSSEPDVQLIQTYHSPVSFVKQLKGDPDAGRKIFKEFCSSCHAANPIIDIQAPRINDKKLWETLGKLGIPALLDLTIKGVKAMPARGGCFECSDQQLKETIEYMLRQ
jgi:cytochrome c5